MASLVQGWSLSIVIEDAVPQWHAAPPVRINTRASLLSEHLRFLPDRLLWTRVLSSFRPDLPRPKTAPELSSTPDSIESPLHERTRRRARSEVSSLSNSFPTSFKPNASIELGEVEHDKAASSSSLDSGTSACRMETASNSANVTRKRKKRRVWAEARKPTDDPNPDENEESREMEFQSYRSLHTRLPMTQTLAEKDAESPASTASPSQPLRLDHDKLEWEGDESFQSKPRSLVDLTTPDGHDRPTKPTYPLVFEEGDKHRCSGVSESGYLETPTPHQQVGLRIRSLPDDVRGPYPEGGRPRFITHVTKTLETLAMRVSLAKHFRPASVARDVQVLERGYWQFWIRIAEDGIVADARFGRGLSKESSGGLCRERWLASAGPVAVWTEDEFIQFWENATQFVQDGKGGWGIRLVKEPDSGNECLWRIRLFTWGEILGHMWLVLWILSDKRTGEMSMQWISSGDSMVVQMLGGKRSADGTGQQWVRKGPEGQGGAWGIG